MTAKQYLQQAYRLNELINSDLAELEQLRVLATSVSSPNLSGMPSGGSRNTEPAFVRAIEKIYDLEKVINSEIEGPTNSPTILPDTIHTNGVTKISTFVFPETKRPT